MSSIFGNLFKISVWGESHGASIGVVIDGVPSGHHIDMTELQKYCDRRRSGKDVYSTPRKESDKVNIVSGILNGHTTGAPISVLVENSSQRSSDYDSLRNIPRPSHADYPASVKYSDYNDISGGGHFSGRLTLPIVIAGGIASQILKYTHGIAVKAYVSAPEKGVSYKNKNIEEILTEDFGNGVNDAMLGAIASARKDGDSLGGVIECVTSKLPVGLGEPMFDSMESVISHLIFSIPAVKGIEFGSGFDIAAMRGSEANDGYFYDGNIVAALSNNNGGICGGLTNGNNLALRVAVKPTPSIAKEQDTVDLSIKENVKLSIKGRHDACIVPRAVVVVESAVAISVMEMIMQYKARH